MAHLTRAQRIRCRDLAVQAALLGYRHKTELHYTQGWRRWDGIRLGRVAADGEYPAYADCSAYATWCLWNGMYVAYHQHDSVNAARWQAGFTGSMLYHGRKVRRGSELKRADCVFYYGHVAICVGHDRRGLPMVVSNGSEGGPYYLPFNYRTVIAMRRYIHDGI